MTAPQIIDVDSMPFRVVFVVGGAGSGRRTAAKIIAEKGAIGPCVLDAFSFELRERCHAAFKLYSDDRLPAPATYFEEQLDTKLDMFAGLSPRSAYDKFAAFLWATHGRECLGRWVVERIDYYRKLQIRKKIPLERHVRAVVLFDDAPAASYKVVADALGANNCTQLVIRRRGTTTLPLDLPGVHTAAVENCGDTVAGFEAAIRQAVPRLFIAIAKEV